MPKIRHIAALLLCATGLQAVAQTRTDTIDYHPPYSDLLPVRCVRTIPFASFDGDRKIDGVMTIAGKSGWDAGQHVDEQQYSESRTYRRGMLNGRFTQSYRHSGTGRAGGRYRINRSWSAEGQFSDGQPDGQWIFSLDSRYSSPDDRSNTTLKERVTFDHGRITDITDQDGNHITIDSKGLIDGKGAIKGGDRVTLHKGIITNTYTDITGESHPMGDKERRLVEQVVSGELTLFTLADRGYTIDWQEVFLAQWARCAEHCDRYARIGDFAPRFSMPKYTVRVGRLTEIETVRDEAAIEYYRQRNKEYDNLKTHAHYNTRYGKRYLSSNAEHEIDRCWRSDQERLLSRTMARLSEMQRNKDLTGCSTDDGEIYELIDWPEIKSRPSGRCIEVYNLLDEALAEVSPVIACQIDTIEWLPYQGYTTHCRVHQLRPDSIGHNTFLATIQVDYNGHLLLDQLATQNYRRIANIWDTVDAHEQMALQRHNQLLNTLGGLKQWRDQYLHDYNETMSDRTPKADVRLKDLSDLDSLQRQLEANIAILSQIDSLDRRAERCKPYRTLQRLYDDFRREADLEWTDSRQRLTQYANLLKQFLALAEKETIQNLERTANIERIRTLKELVEHYQ